MKKILLFFILISLILTNTQAQQTEISFTSDFKAVITSNYANCTFIDLDGDGKIIIDKNTPKKCSYTYLKNKTAKVPKDFDVKPYQFKSDLILNFDNVTTTDTELKINFFAIGSGEFNVTCKECETHDPIVIEGCGNIPNNINGILNESILNAPDTCIVFTGSNSELDCDGYTIDGDDDDYGVYLNDKQNNTIKNCIITQFSYGIYLFNASNNTITNNSVNDNFDIGVYLNTNALNNTIYNNTMNSNSYGFTASGFSDGNNIYNNTANNNFRGIYATQSILFISNNTVCDNTNSDFYSVDWYGSTGHNNSCDEHDGWNDTGTTGCSYYCSICTSNLVNGSWMYKFNSSCLPNNTEIYYYELIQEDLNGCIDNVTFYTQNSSICDYCTENLTNSSWIDGECLINDSYNQTCIQYDINNCNETENLTFIRWLECDYCIPDLINTSWVYVSSGACLSNNSKLDYYELTQYDNNLCIDNVTYSMSNYSSCNYTAPETIDFGLFLTTGLLTTDNITYFILFLIMLIIIYVITKLLTKNEK